jgi:membrane associated rhomboid family serine protease
LIAANIIVFIVYWVSFYNLLFSNTLANAMNGEFIMVPSEIVQGQRLYTLFTSMFMHDTSSLEAGGLHIFGNMLYLFIFGDNVEDAFGHVSYFFLYLFSGLAADFAHIMSLVYFPVPNGFDIGVLGASGAISGVLGAYIVLYPKAKILTLVTYVILPLPAILFLGIWFVMQWLYVLFGISAGIAYWAHIGGFIAGIMLALAVGRRRKRARDARLRL